MGDMKADARETPADATHDGPDGLDADQVGRNPDSNDRRDHERGIGKTGLSIQRAKAWMASIQIGEADDQPEGSVEPRRAELVDGANVLFVDVEARSKPIYQYDLAVITGSQYPDPIVLKNDAPIEIPEGAALSASTPGKIMLYAGRRVVARGATLVEPERADQIPRDARVELPDGLAGEAVPVRECQSPEFYRAVVAELSEGSR